MLLTITSTVLQTLLAVVMLMVVLLLLTGMNRLFSSDGDEIVKAKKLRRDVDRRQSVISDESVFNEFLVRSHQHHSKYHEK